MEIAIKSETDSRILLYPLMKILKTYGTVAVYTSNRYLRRLIENELEGGFRDIRVVVSPEADLDEVKLSDEYFPGKYDFTIYDNIGAVDYDIQLAIITNRISEAYVSDLLFAANDEKTHILKFGSPAPTVSAGKKSEKSSPKKKGQEPTSEEDDRAYNKWFKEKTDEDLFQEMLNNRTNKWCKFPTYESIEQLESRYKFMIPDDVLVKELYRLFGTQLCTDERQFTKGAKLQDEGSSDISGTDVR